MKYDQAIERLHARAAATTGTPDGMPGIGCQRMEREDFARRMLGDLVPLGELDEVLAGLDVVAANVGRGLLTVGMLAGPAGQIETLYTTVTQVLTLGLLLKSPPVVAVEDAA